MKKRTLLESIVYYITWTFDVLTFVTFIVAIITMNSNWVISAGFMMVGCFIMNALSVKMNISPYQE